MTRSKKSANPFYLLLVAFGLAFVVTAAAYGVMTVARNAGRSQRFDVPPSIR